MKKCLISFLCGFMICGAVFAAYADQPIAIIVNGQTIQSEVAPMVVDGKVMVPTRVIAEALGAEVQWDGANNAVVITSQEQTTPPLIQETVTGTDMQHPVPAGQSFLCPDGMRIRISEIERGSEAWAILQEAYKFNQAPEGGKQYVLIRVAVENVSYEGYDGSEERYVGDGDFTLQGSSGSEYSASYKPAVQPDSGLYASINKTLVRGGKTSGALCFYVPSDESDLIVKYKPFLSATYFAVE